MPSEFFTDRYGKLNIKAPVFPVSLIGKRKRIDIKTDNKVTILCRRQIFQADVGIRK